MGRENCILASPFQAAMIWGYDFSLLGTGYHVTKVWMSSFCGFLLVFEIFSSIDHPLKKRVVFVPEW